MKSVGDIFWRVAKCETFSLRSEICRATYAMQEAHVLNNKHPNYSPATAALREAQRLIRELDTQLELAIWDLRALQWPEGHATDTATEEGEQ